jgi:cytoplasmic iron level regulating protein YaaA (DUF328/UPF0246 family)
MKLVLSPAKSLNFESKLPTSMTSESCFLKESERLNRLLKKKICQEPIKTHEDFASFGPT